MDEVLGAVQAFVERVAGDRPFALGGTSFGAYLALGIARRRPRNLAGLLLSVPEVHHSPVEDRMARAAGRPAGGVPTLLAEAQDASYHEDTAWLTGLPWRDVAVDLYDRRKVVRAPTLLLFGRQDLPFRARRYFEILPGFPNATFAVLDGAGHALWRDKPDLARELVQDWLDRVEARA
jgi:pimeloyl-ACP methyl ester carboxylesterase